MPTSASASPPAPRLNHIQRRHHQRHPGQPLHDQEQPKAPVQPQHLEPLSQESPKGDGAFLNRRWRLPHQGKTQRGEGQHSRAQAEDEGVVRGEGQGVRTAQEAPDEEPGPHPQQAAGEEAHGQEGAAPPCGDGATDDVVVRHAGYSTDEGEGRPQGEEGGQQHTGLGVPQQDQHAG
ncbi:MAG: hypothetical protein ACE5LU_13695 [Anaerolineae bacterium]